MANNGTFISGNVAISDVQTVLGASANDLGTLCKHSNINKWSLRKPIIKANRLDQLSEQDYKDADYGFTISAVSYTDMMNDLKRNGGPLFSNWRYDRPTGGLAAPYRLTDFLGYNHHGESPFTYEIQSNQVMQGGSIQVSFVYGDLNTWAFVNSYPYICLVVPNIGVYPLSSSNFAKTTADVIGEGKLVAPLSSLFSANTTYKAYVAMTNLNATSQTWNPSGYNTSSYVPLPYFGSNNSFTILSQVTAADFLEVSGSGTFQYANRIYRNISFTPKAMLLASRTIGGITRTCPTGTFYVNMSFSVGVAYGTQSVLAYLDSWAVTITNRGVWNVRPSAITKSGPYEVISDPKDDVTLVVNVSYELRQNSATGSLVSSGSTTVHLTQA